MVFTALLEECEEGGYTVTVPTVPGCISEGDTYQYLHRWTGAGRSARGTVPVDSGRNTRDSAPCTGILKQVGMSAEELILTPVIPVPWLLVCAGDVGRYPSLVMNKNNLPCIA